MDLASGKKTTSVSTNVVQLLICSTLLVRERYVLRVVVEAHLRLQALAHRLDGTIALVRRHGQLAARHFVRAVLPQQRRIETAGRGRWRQEASRTVRLVEELRRLKVAICRKAVRVASRGRNGELALHGVVERSLRQ